MVNQEKIFLLHCYSQQPESMLYRHVRNIVQIIMVFFQIIDNTNQFPKHCLSFTIGLKLQFVSPDDLELSFHDCTFSIQKQSSFVNYLGEQCQYFLLLVTPGSAYSISSKQRWNISIYSQIEEPCYIIYCSKLCKDMVHYSNFCSYYKVHYIRFTMIVLSSLIMI